MIVAVTKDILFNILFHYLDFKTGLTVIHCLENSKFDSYPMASENCLTAITCYEKSTFDSYLCRENSTFDSYKA